MARTYKRDKNGRFAGSGGSGGGKSLRQTVQSKRSIGQARTYKPAANTPQGREVKRLTGSDRAVVGTRRIDTGMHKGGLHAAHTVAARKRSANVKLEKQRNASVVASSSASSSRGKSSSGKALTGNRTYKNAAGKTVRAGAHLNSKFDKPGVRAAGFISGDSMEKRAQGRATLKRKKK